VKVILLCAGKGERLYPLTKLVPKSLIDLGGETLLEKQLREIRKSGVVHEVVLVVGYLGHLLEGKAQELSTEELPIRCTFNPFFDVSNNLLSLWLARHEMKEDFLISNGDNLFDSGTYKNLVRQQRGKDGVFLTVKARTEFDIEDMKVSIAEGFVRRVSKDMAPPEANAESPGLSLVQGHVARARYTAVLEELARDPAYRNRFWLETYNRLALLDAPSLPWNMPGECCWQEIDFHLDIGRARELLRLKTLQ
jgi:L-glutamine-phosphate cytidylyltransferase